MVTEPHKERTLVILKPDAIQRSLMGEIIGRFERAGLKFIGMKFVVPTEDQLKAFYNKDDAWYQKKGERIIEDIRSHGREPEKEAIEYGKDIIRTIVRYMTETPVLAMVLEGNQSIGIVRKLVGETEPLSADVGTIRGDYTIDSYGHSTYENRAVKNLIHASDEVEEAKREIVVWFDEGELYEYATAQERIMYEAIRNQ